MDTITTFTGEDFAPRCPDPDKLHLRDIAHALSLLTRANGHFAQFYSVGQHSLNCAREAGPRALSPGSARRSPPRRIRSLPLRYSPPTEAGHGGLPPG